MDKAIKILECALELEAELEKHFYSDLNGPFVDEINQAIRILKATQEPGLTEDESIKRLKGE